MDIFRQSWLKIERADEHIAELDKNIRDFLDAKPYAVVVNPSMYAGQQTWSARVRKKIPEKITMIVGDALHNMRAALDILTCDLIRHFQGVSTDLSDIYFPFTKGDANDFESLINKRLVKETSPDVIAVFRKLAPYKAGNPVLFALHSLDIDDKHKRIIPMANFIGIPSLKLIANGQSIMTMVDGKFFVSQDGATLMSLPAANNIKLNQEFDPTIEIVFGEVNLVKHQPLIPTLHHISDAVQGTIKAFEAL